MKHACMEAIPLNKLWSLHHEITELLVRKTEQELLDLEMRLAVLHHTSLNVSLQNSSKVRPKFQNPENPNQSWSGRGRQPRWVREFLSAGKSIDELRIGSKN